MLNKIITFILSSLFAFFIATGCKSETATEPEGNETITTNGTNVKVGTTGKTIDEISAANKKDHEAADDYTWNNSDIIPIVLSGTAISSNNSGVTVSGSIVTTFSCKRN